MNIPARIPEQFYFQFLAEAFGLPDPCDTSIAIKHDLKQIISETLMIKGLKDSETLFRNIATNEPTTEMFFMMYVKAAREAYHDLIIKEIHWIRKK